MMNFNMWLLISITVVLTIESFAMSQELDCVKRQISKLTDDRLLEFIEADKIDKAVELCQISMKMTKANALLYIENLMSKDKAE